MIPVASPKLKENILFVVKGDDLLLSCFKTQYFGVERKKCRCQILSKRSHIFDRFSKRLIFLILFLFYPICEFKAAEKDAHQKIQQQQRALQKEKIKTASEIIQKQKWVLGMEFYNYLSNIERAPFVKESSFNYIYSGTWDVIGVGNFQKEQLLGIYANSLTKRSFRAAF